LAAENVFRLVYPGMHIFSKSINPDNFVGFFEKPLTEGVRPWISRTYVYGLLTHVEAEVRGVVYVPCRGELALVLRPMTPWSTQGNYLFWVRRPNDTVSRPYHKL
jgi:polyprenyldihydroxybenzoate methyltransferase/3-demethylubiquinol 3-O-methyltransferase